MIFFSSVSSGSQRVLQKPPLLVRQISQFEKRAGKEAVPNTGDLQRGQVCGSKAIAIVLAPLLCKWVILPSIAEPTALTPYFCLILECQRCHCVFP